MILCIGVKEMCGIQDYLFPLRYNLCDGARSLFSSRRNIEAKIQFQKFEIFN